MTGENFYKEVSMRMVVVGAGNVGTALAVLFQKAGHQIIGIISFSATSAASAAKRINAAHSTDLLAFTRQAEVVFLTTPDRVISKVCEQIAFQNGFSPSTIVIHTSGAHSSTILESACQNGAYPLSFHPLQTFANPDAGIENLPGSYITIEGHEAALPVARQLVEDLECKLLEIPTSAKPLYHAAACIACNYFTTLIEEALQVMEAAGICRENGLPALYPLIEGTLKNIKRVGTIQALTGPIARGDASTLKTQLTAMEDKIPERMTLYKLLGRATMELALAKGTLGDLERQKLLESFGGDV